MGKKGRGHGFGVDAGFRKNDLTYFFILVGLCVRLSVLLQRQPKSQKEQTGRAKLDLLFQNLNQQLEPNESCSKADILNKVLLRPTWHTEAM